MKCPILLLFLFTVSLASCKKEQVANSNGSMYGSWNSNKVTDYGILPSQNINLFNITIREDNSFSLKAKEWGDTAITHIDGECYYNTDEKSLLCTTTDSDNFLLTIKSVGESQLILRLDCDYDEWIMIESERK